MNVRNNYDFELQSSDLSQLTIELGGKDQKYGNLKFEGVWNLTENYLRTEILLSLRICKNAPQSHRSADNKQVIEE